MINDTYKQWLKYKLGGPGTLKKLGPCRIYGGAHVKSLISVNTTIK